ncbi:hypothetical protein ACHAXA_003217 [Cyclostephanos tholiformis]|uniref:Peptidase S54 rhomboid domain-containing protein n=1 Tax=Cyclostephanos tholiformis TaxID=382380 RepID=A0ABD3RYM0_9STRA
MAYSDNTNNDSTKKGDSESDSGLIEAPYVPKINSYSSRWGGVKTCCRLDYKSSVLQQVIEEHGHKDGSRATIDQLKEFGITVYLAQPEHVDVLLLRQVVQHCSASRLDRSRSPYENQRCLLYRDETGRLYNLTINNSCDGLAGKWKGLFVEYSGLQAMVAFTVLARAYACANVAGAILKPGYLVFILGLLLHEEISHTWLNIAMFIQGMPSVAAFTIVSSFDSDWPRKVSIFLLAITSAMEVGSTYQRYCALVGIGLAMVLLLANLGARAWYFMKWKPLRGGVVMSSFLAPFLSLIVAVVTGFIFPFIGFARIQAGGKSAIQLIIFNCIIVSLFFVASEFDIIQQLVIDPSQSCDQDGVTICIGIWIAMAVITSTVASQKINPPDPHPEDANPILVEDQTSPVGYKVPNFPDFPIDPIHFGNKGLPCCSLQFEMLVGLFVGILMGTFVVATALFDFLNDANEYISDIL